MSQVFMAGANNETLMHPLTETALISEPTIRNLAENQPENPENDVILTPADQGSGWILQFRNGRRGVWVNGLERTLGFYRLGDGDRVRVVGGCELEYTDEQQVTPRIYRETGHPLKCRYCQTAVKDGQEVVVCSECQAVYHHIPGPRENCCWRCEDTCSSCGASTAMDDRLHRIPEVF